MNKGLFFAESFKFFDITMKEKLDEYNAPPWSPNIDKLSPIKKYNTPFCKTLQSCDTESFNTCKLEFRSPESAEDESTPPLASETAVKVSLPPTPTLRKPMSVIMSRIRRIDFDLPEDYELQVKSTTADIDCENVNETVV